MVNGSYLANSTRTSSTKTQKEKISPLKKEGLLINTAYLYFAGWPLGPLNPPRNIALPPWEIICAVILPSDAAVPNAVTLSPVLKSVLDAVFVLLNVVLSERFTILLLPSC